MAQAIGRLNRQPDQARVLVQAAASAETFGNHARRFTAVQQAANVLGRGRRGGQHLVEIHLQPDLIKQPMPFRDPNRDHQPQR